MKTQYFVPKQMKFLNRWNYWKLVDKDGKKTKIPINAKTLKSVSTTKLEDWNDYDFCYNKVNQVKNYVSGFGYVFTRDDNIVFIDLDHCIENGVINEFAMSICRRFKDTYQEISQSGSGIHIFCYGSIDKSLKTEKIEIYNHERYVAFTGKSINCKELCDYSDEVKQLYLENQKKEEVKIQPIEIEYDAKDEYKIIECIKKSKNGYRFMELFGGMVESNSENTLALASILAFWTQKNASMIKSIILRSGLYREKMLSKRGNITWLDYVINTALSSCRETYNPTTKKEYQQTDMKKQTKQIEMLGQDLYFKLGDYEYNTIQKERCFSNISELDKMIGGFTYNCITLWTAQTNGGKTTLLSGLVKEFIKQGKKIFYFNGEQDKDTFKNNLYKQLVGKENIKRKQYDNREIYDYFIKPESLSKAQMFYDNNIYVYNNDVKRDIDTLIYAMEELNEKEKVRDFIIDNLMQLDMETNDIFREQKNVMEKLRTFAVNRECNVHLVAHPRKTESKNVRVSIWDVAGTMDIANKSYNVISIIRIDQIEKESNEYNVLRTYCFHQGYDFDEASCILEVLKQKDGTGTGIVALKYEPLTKTFKEMAKQDMTHKIEKTKKGVKQK